MVHLIQNIRKVECVEAYHLQHSDIIADRGVWLNVYQQFNPISTIGLSSVEISDKIENKQRVFTTKLTMFRQRSCYLVPRSSALRWQPSPAPSSWSDAQTNLTRLFRTKRVFRQLPAESPCNSYCYPDFYHSDAFHIRLRSFYTIYIRYNIAYTNFWQYGI